ncbi:hypothetical protein BDV59DRAFT_180333 [Aspergillus ambiguus]|uniref:uncharacterized protein n=1 Tax=Aspergillus ambiguus TaxID=176160 RepID=UPI003CCCAC66
MHKIIDENEVQHLQNTIAETKGGMYTNQLAYHAWSQLAGQYLRQLSPEKVKTENTRFNVLVRRFLD